MRNIKPLTSIIYAILCLALFTQCSNSRPNDIKQQQHQCVNPDSIRGIRIVYIDLDTVMTSTSLYDFGDAIRSYTNTGKEDDNNLDNVSMDLERFRAFAEGYLSEQKSLNSIELQWLAFSARYITYEQALRFLMDYINGDTYYKIAFPEHNLIRTCAQLHLLESMEEQYDAMCAIILELS